ncbi:hypothetical protein PFX98_00990 [Paucibacter sediminis]|uniref:Uncharacterized protein n=1 Tax=Paucibacter sediminis TaxID=3019553 RepID=A0AA95NBQ7_9BURK|nr:hypothetical protein [Paucibacter sp. S2-9]WIT12210.1 hypothetical protein PFX98_00990 [Paucibacter sp. S2-9]
MEVNMVRVDIRTSFSLLCLLLFQAGAAVAQADSGATSNEALATISGFAREFCLSADSTSRSTSVELSGDAKVKLNAVISKIVGLEIGGGGKYIDTNTEGVLQKDLAAAYQDTNRCRMAVLELLGNRLLPAQAPSASAARMAGRWRDGTDDTVFINVVVRGRDFHSIEYNRFGQPTGSIDAVVAEGNVEGMYFIEPTQPGNKTFVVAERTMVGTVTMRLSQDEQRLVGTFVTKKANMAVPFEWVRP